MEKVKFVQGIISVREIPVEWSPADYAYWWLPEKNSEGKVIRAARMSNREKQRYTVAETENTLTSAGRTAVLNFLGNTTVSFFQFFSVGTGSISAVSAADTTMASELFRKAPASATPAGSQIDVATLFATSEGNGTWSNSGVFGNGATSTLGSGTLYTHSLFSYAKSSSIQVSCDYVFILGFS